MFLCPRCFFAACFAVVVPLWCVPAAEWCLGVDLCAACGDASIALSPAGLRGIESLLGLPLADANQSDLTDRAAREALRVVTSSHEYHGGFQLRTLKSA